MGKQILTHINSPGVSLNLSSYFTAFPPLPVVAVSAELGFVDVLSPDPPSRCEEAVLPVASGLCCCCC